MDTNAKHTPGPWTEFRDDDSHDIIADDGTHLARMEPVNGLAPQREQDANACLMAAAPDLLAALEAVAETIGRNGEVSRLSDYGLADLGNLTRAAISNARGGARRKAVCLVVVSGGIAEAYAPAHVDCRIVDLDNIGAGDSPETLPAGIGFEELAQRANLETGREVVIAPRRPRARPRAGR